MVPLQVYKLIPRRALITRESARVLKEPLIAAMNGEVAELKLDFAGVEAVTPSFVDELITVLGEIAHLKKLGFQVSFLNPPTRLSEKFLAIARGHGLIISESSPGAWTITGVAA